LPLLPLLKKVASKTAKNWRQKPRQNLFATLKKIATDFFATAFLKSCFFESCFFESCFFYIPYIK
jgi:hypothetical protein